LAGQPFFAFSLAELERWRWKKYIVYNSIYLDGGLEHFLFFHNIWDNPSHGLIFFRGVETTNQI
jgi:hypothetical protein